MRLRLTSALGAAALAIGITALAVPASAHPAGDTTAKGTCSADSVAKLSASSHGDSIKVKAKIKTGAAGEDWIYVIADNGNTVVSDTATSGDNGKVRIRTSIPNLDGTDTIDFYGADSITGEVCTAEVAVD